MSDIVDLFSHRPGPPDEPPRTMSSREIAEVCEKRHFHVMRDVRAMLEALGLPLGGYIQNWMDPQNGQTYEEFRLPKDLCMTLVTGYDVKMRHRIMQWWVEFEAAHTPPALPNFADPAAAARAWADQVEQNARSAAQIADMTPKVEELALMQHSEGSKLLRDVAKDLGVGERRLRKWMHANGWIYRQGPAWVAYAARVKARHLENHVRTYQTPEMDVPKTTSTLMITPAGMALLAKRIRADIHGFDKIATCKSGHDLSTRDSGGPL